MAFDAMIQIRLDEKDKVAADELFSSLGLETSTAIRMFIKRAIMLQRFPFDISEKLTTDDIESVDGVPVWKNKRGVLCCDFEDYLDHKLGKDAVEATDEDEEEYKKWCFNNRIVDPSKNKLVLMDEIADAFSPFVEHQFLRKNIKFSKSEYHAQYIYGNAEHNHKYECLCALLKYWVLHSKRDTGFLTINLNSVIKDANNVIREIEGIDILSILDYVEDAIPNKQRWLNGIHIPMIIYVGELAKEKGISSENFGERINKFFETTALEKEFRENCVAGNAKKERIQKRLEIMLKILD